MGLLTVMLMQDELHCAMLARAKREGTGAREARKEMERWGQKKRSGEGFQNTDNPHSVTVNLGLIPGINSTAVP